MATTKCKCHGCTERHDGCHSTCEDYKAYTQAREEEKAKIKKARDAHSAYWGHKVDSMKKQFKRNGKALKHF
jgi:hypothetical protein